MDLRTSSTPFPSVQPRFDVLRLPVLGRFLLWKHSRTAVQLVLFGLSAIIILDGLLGSQLAAKNVATTAAWVHYRGLVVLALLLAGNLFCAGCPFLLPRKLARWLGRPAQRWPRRLRNKWLALASFLGILFAYELFDLWASPWWTAWVAVGYFVAAFVLEALFTRDSFCLYICPLGTFNFLYSTASPLQITSRDLQTCRVCPGHECINGRKEATGQAAQQGCQLELYVPTIRSNLDCTFCLDCAKACPYDNVALVVRPPGDELFRQSWPNRPDLALLAILAAFAALVNAFAMTPPVYDLELWLANVLNTRQEWIVLGLIFLVGIGVIPLALVCGAIWWGLRLGQQQQAWRLLLRYAYSFVPIGFAVWSAHYGFHFLVGSLTLVPALQNFFAGTLGWPLLGQPDWQLAGTLIPPAAAVQTFQVVVMGAGWLGAMAVALSAARRVHAAPRTAWLELAPWAAILLAIAAIGIMIFLLPMEMRGSVLGG